MVLWAAVMLGGCLCQDKPVPDEDASSVQLRRKHHFDFLMFTQIWPITSCLTWEDRGYEHSCTIDDSAKQWTIHGIWPTSNHQIGPLYCNRTDKFDPEKISNLLPELRSKWTDVRAGGGDEYNFWRHEWEKHGTCAEQLPSMANEYLYFKKALDLHSQYNVTALLSDRIVPGSILAPMDVVAELTSALQSLDKVAGAHPAINCAHDKKFKDPLFYEIIICFDKEFNRIGCENTKGGLYGSCGDARPFFYPDSIHPNWIRNTVVMLMFPVLCVLCFPLACSVIYLIFGKKRRQGYVRFDQGCETGKTLLG